MEDLLQGPVSRPYDIDLATSFDGRADFFVSDVDASAIAPEQWDMTIALNMKCLLCGPACRGIRPRRGNFHSAGTP